MSTFLDDLQIYNAKAAVVIKNLVVNGDSETATLLSSLKSTANDESLNNTIRLNALTALINRGELLNVGVPPFFPTAVSFRPTFVYTGLHNALDGLNTGDFYHLTYAEYLSLIALLDGGTAVTFENLTGLVAENPPLVNAFALKQDIIPTSTASKFYSWDKTWRDIDWSYIASKPTTLSGFGILAGDTLFDGKYIQQSSVLSSYVIGTNAPITNSNTLVGAFGNLQAQINAFVANSGTISTVGINTPVGFFLTVGNSPLPSGGGYMSLSLASQTQGTVFAAPAGSNAAPSFRALVASDLPTTGFSANTYGSNTQWPIISVDIYGRITNVSLQSATGSGTVQSVEVTMPAEFTESGNPITVDGTIAFAWDNQTEGLVFASPVDSTGVPGFRELSPFDIPDIEQVQVVGLVQALADLARSTTLPNAQIYIGNPSSEPVPQAVTGVITINNAGVTSSVSGATPLSALVNQNSKTLLGRYTANVGQVETITLSNDFTLSGSGVLSFAGSPVSYITAPGQLITYNASLPGVEALPAPTAGQVLIGFPTRPTPNEYGLIWVTLGGVVSSVGTDGVVALADNSIDYTKLKNASVNTILGVGSTAGAISALNATDATAILDSFGGTTKGLVPGGSSGNATLFLNGAGGWTSPSGSGTVTSSTVGRVAYYTGLTTVDGLAFAGAGKVLKTNSTNDGLEWGTAGSGIISLADGGTNFNNTAISGGVAYSTADAIKITAAGTTAGQILQSNVTSAPTWSTATYPSTTGINKILYSSANNVVGEIVAPTDGKFLKYTTAGGFSWDDAGSGGGGGGGNGVNYYLNGSVTPSPAVAGYNQMSRVANTGAAANFTVNNTTGFALMAQFVTDANDPALLNIPAGAWDFNFYFGSSNNTANPQFYVQLLKYDGTTETSIATGIATPETIVNGTTVDLYTTSITIPSSTVLTITDRLIIRVYVDTDGSRTITFYTQGTRLAEVFTTFTTGVTALNGLTAQVQFFGTPGTAGTAPAWTSTTATHTLDIPLASAASVTAGLISNSEYDIFNGKMSNPMTAEGDIIYGGVGGVPTPLARGADGKVLILAGGLPAWGVAGTGDVTGPSGGVTDGDFAVFDGITGKIIKKSAGASLSATGAAVFNDSVTVGVSGPSGGTTGQLVFRNSSNAGRTIIQGSDSQAAVNINYYLPVGLGTTTQVLALADNFGNLTWSSAGTGDVTRAGTQTFTGSNTFNNNTFILRNSANTFTTIVNAPNATSNWTISFPNIAGTVALANAGQTISGINTFTAAQTFNSSVSIGANTGGSFRIQNTVDAAYTTIASNATISSRTFTLPNADGIAALTNANQTFSAVQSFSGTVRVLGTGTFGIGNPSSADFTIFASQANLSSQTITFPNLSGTVALLSNAQTFTGAKTFQAGISLTTGGTFATAAAVASTFSGSVTMSFAGGATTPQLTISGGTHNFINLNGATGIPSTPTRSAGTKIVLFSNPGGIDAALGVAGSGELWNSTSVSFGWYCNTITASLNLTVSALTLTSLSLIGSATQNVFNTVSTTVNFAGVATALTIASGVTAAQTVNMFTGSTGASTYNFATGATASATTKAINIGTGGTSGSTTNITFGTATTTNLRFFGSANTSGKPTVTGSRGSNAALASFLTAMSNLGLITDSTTA